MDNGRRRLATAVIHTVRSSYRGVWECVSVEGYGFGSYASGVGVAQCQGAGLYGEQGYGAVGAMASGQDLSGVGD